MSRLAMGEIDFDVRKVNCSWRGESKPSFESCVFVQSLSYSGSQMAKVFEFLLVAELLSGKSTKQHKLKKSTGARLYIKNVPCLKFNDVSEKTVRRFRKSRHFSFSFAS